MKKVTYLSLVVLAFSALMLNGCGKKKTVDPNKPTGITVPQEQKSLFFDLTATWCPPCGAWGIPTFESAVAGGPVANSYGSTGVSFDANKVCGISSHGSTDNLSNTTATEITKFFAPAGIPSFAEGTKLYNQDYTNWAKAIQSTIAMTPTAGVGLTKTVSGSAAIDVKTSVKFFSAMTGEFNLAVYFVEDGVIDQQQVAGKGLVNPFTHSRVLRGVATLSGGTSSTWGAKITSGSVAAGIVFPQSWTFTPSVGEVSKMHAVAVIWEMSGGKPVKMVNCNKLD